MSAAPDTRTPHFLLQVQRKPPMPAPFSVVPTSPGPPPEATPALFRVAAAPAELVVVPPLAPPGVAVAPSAVMSPPPVPPPPRMPEESPHARLSAAVEQLRMVASSLAEHARSDAMEIGFLVAKRILEGEVKGSPEALFSLVRGALERVGQTRSVNVRLCPADAERVEAAGGAPAWSGVSIAEVNIVPDAALSPGDVMIDSELGHVDGRLQTRLDELRAAIPAAPDHL